jgi:hypothetical protein
VRVVERWGLTRVKVSEMSLRTRERRIVIAGWSERGRDSSLGWVGVEIRRTHGSTVALSCLGHGRDAGETELYPYCKFGKLRVP